MQVEPRDTCCRVINDGMVLVTSARDHSSHHLETASMSWLAGLTETTQGIIGSSEVTHMHFLFTSRLLLHTRVCKYKSVKAECNETAADNYLQFTQFYDQIYGSGSCSSRMYQPVQYIFSEALYFLCNFVIYSFLCFTVLTCC